MKKGNVIWILEDEPGCQMVYRETLDCLYQTFYYTSLKEFNEDLENTKCKNVYDSSQDYNFSVPAPELIIADLKLEDGFFTDYLEEKGEKHFPCPFFVVSTYNELDLFRQCTAGGSLDFMVKPFRKNELIFKLEKIFKNKSINRVFHFLKSNKIDLTAKERKLLKFFSSHDRAVSHDEIVQSVWKGAYIHENNVNVQISRIREKLENSPYSIVNVGTRTWILETEVASSHSSEPSMSAYL
ncbi:MAG: winged helix-turn-helix domain-containing protein [Bacteriovoracales bacterium]|nr:winged helix-turn-helix domain-containing protein [Bacteriovoracales bacterium]